MKIMITWGFILIFFVTAAYAANHDNVIYLAGEQAESTLNTLRENIINNPNDVIALKNAGIILHQMSREEPDQKKVEEAEKYLKRAYQANKADYETLAWLGSTITMKAQFENDPGRQTFFVKSGSLKMDKSVRAEPDNTIIRLTRAYNSLEIPAFLRRTRFAVEDFEAYLALCEQHGCVSQELNMAKQSLQLAKEIIANNP